MKENKNVDIKFIVDNSKITDKDITYLDQKIIQTAYASQNKALEDNPYSFEDDQKSWVSWRYGWFLAFFEEITDIMMER